MKKTLLLLLVFAFATVLNGFAKTVEIGAAKLAGKNFYYERINQYSAVPYNTLSITSEFTISENTEPVYYVFNFKDKGFIIIAADDIVYPVLGYSFESSYSNENQPENFKFWMKIYKEEILADRLANTAPGTEIINTWNHLNTNDPNNLDNLQGILDVLPLTPALWDQTWPYNAMCPQDANSPGGYNGRVPVGCVATSMVQIMYYWRYPNMGQGSHCISPQPTYGPQCANFGTTTYDWNGMNNQPSKECDPIALISWHAGIAVDMHYGPSGSGANMSKVGPAFKNYFKYDAGVQDLYRQYYSYSSWIGMMKSDLDIKQPLIYSGDDGTTGHAWVCDGYQGTEMFHMNWGWSGAYNGYFNINNLNAGGYTPNYNQTCVFGIKPDATQYPYNCTGQTNITTYDFGTIEDGSGPIANYQNNLTCSWLIAPDDSVQSVTLSWYRFDVDASDNVTVYDGPTTSSPLLGTYNGTTLPPTLTSTGPQMLVTFTTNGSTNSQGWMANYSSLIFPFCANVTNLTDQTGNFNDGSGRFMYRNSTNCKWKIQPPDATSVTLTFNSFNTEQDLDKVQIYDLGNGALLGAFSGNYATPPGPVTATSGKMYIIFTSGQAVRGEGWDASYTIFVGTKDNKSIENLKIYPNPTQDFLSIDFTVNEIQSVKVDLTSIKGETIYSESIGNFRGDFSKNLDLSNLAKGIYLLRITSDKGTSTSKVIVQ